jgi:Transcriptional regulator, AbiEi antitoxin
LVDIGRYSHHIDHQIAERARKQHGYVTRAQLLGLGLSPDAVKRRLAAGSLIRVHDGVYAVGHVRGDPVSRGMAAVLACGAGAVLSHHSAAALWGFRNWRSGPIHVIAPGKHRRPGLESHRCALTRMEWTMHRGVRLTTPARTLLDIRRELTHKQLIRAIGDALISNYMYESHLAGTPLERFVDEVSRSALEDDFKPWLRKHNLPEPLYNVTLFGREVDVYYPDARLIVELDGWPFHRTKIAFENDRDRDATMLAHGIATVRITRERLENAPDREADRLLIILEARWA